MNPSKLGHIARRRQAFALVTLLVTITLSTLGGGVSARAVTTPDSLDVMVVQTTHNLSEHLTQLADVQFQDSRPRGIPVISVDDRKQYQRINGFGAAMTDSSAWLIYDELGPDARSALMNDLFSSNGIHLDFVRVPMGASDFTAKRRPYSYDDLPPGKVDPQLRRFSINHDRAYILPTLHQMRSIDPSVDIIANPWSPPGWMKSNDALNNIGHAGDLLPRYYSAWANYFVKFLTGYAGAGVHVTAITPQNQPGAPGNYPGMQLPEATEAYLVANYLRPALRRAGLHTRIYGGDEGWDSSYYSYPLAGGPDRSAFDGISWHCYGGIPDVMTGLHALHPKLDQIENECAPSDTPYSVPEILIGSMRNWATAAELWNIALDPRGQPVQPPNDACGRCRGVVTVNEATHAYSFRIDYFQLGQLSKFVQRGAVRIGSNNLLRYFVSGRQYGAGQGLDDVAFRNPDGSHVVVVYNNTGRRAQFAVSWHGESFTYTMPATATVTFVWNQGN